jgi:hypothetical protein
MTDVLLAVADFDDPNIDREGAIIGALGNHPCRCFSWHAT